MFLIKIFLIIYDICYLYYIKINVERVVNHINYTYDYYSYLKCEWEDMFKLAHAYSPRIMLVHFSLKLYLLSTFIIAYQHRNMKILFHLKSLSQRTISSI